LSRSVTRKISAEMDSLLTDLAKEEKKTKIEISRDLARAYSMNFFRKKARQDDGLNFRFP